MISRFKVSIDRYMEYVQGSTKGCTHRWRDKCAEERMELCDTILTSCSMLKYNRHQNTGTDKLHNMSITQYVQPDRIQGRVKSIHFSDYQFKNTNTDRKITIGKQDIYSSNRMYLSQSPVQLGLSPKDLPSEMYSEPKLQNYLIFSQMKIYLFSPIVKAVHTSCEKTANTETQNTNESRNPTPQTQMDSSIQIF